MTNITERPRTNGIRTTSPSTTPTTNAPLADDADIESIEAVGTRDNDVGFTRGSALAEARPDREVPILGTIDDDGFAFDADKGFDVEGADATMVGRLPPPRSSMSFKSAEQGIAALESKYKVTIAREGWSLEEVARLHESLALLGGKEREELKGVHLRREHSPSSPVPNGAAGFFFRNVAPNEKGERAAPPTIVWYDAAFPTSGNGDVDRRHSMQVVLHEVAHAVDEHDATDALAADNGAIVRARIEKNLATKLETGLKAFTAQMPTSKGEGPRAFNDSVRAWGIAFKAVQQAKTPEQLDKATARLHAAAEARDAALMALATDDPVFKVATALAFARDASGTHAAAREFTPVQHDKRSYVTHGPVTTTTELRTPEVIALEKMLGDETPISPHGATAAPENFADLYGVYRRDPQWLSAHHPKAAQWMRAHYP